MNTLSGILMLVIVASLAGNAFQFIWFYEVRSALDDKLNELIRAENIISEYRSGVLRIHAMYRKELEEQRKMFMSHRNKSEDHG